MRYYDLTVADPKTGQILSIADQKGKTPLHFTSYPNGIGGLPDAGALNVRFDCFMYAADQPMGGSTISIDGIDPNFLRQAHNFTGKALTLKAGMGPGLPLANPKQAGMIVQGKVWQSFGNWRGTEISGNFVVTGAEYSLAKPGNLVLNWKAGTPLSTAITNTLQTAYPGVQVHVQIADVVLSHDEVHFASTIQGLATMLAGITKPPVKIYIFGQTILVSDGSAKPTPKPISFYDMIGQPVWIEPAVVIVKVTMRSNIWPGDVITFPQAPASLAGFALTAVSAVPSAPNYQSAFQGNFAVQSVRQVGNLRDPNGEAWCTVIKAGIVTPPAAAS